jgi:hypothetical protein
MDISKIRKTIRELSLERFKAEMELINDLLQLAQLEDPNIEVNSEPTMEQTICLT